MARFGDALRGQNQAGFLRDLGILLVFLLAECAGEGGDFVLAPLATIEHRTFLQLLIKRFQRVVDFLVFLVGQVWTIRLRHFGLSRHKLLATPLWHFLSALADVGDFLRHLHLLFDLFHVPVVALDLPDRSQKILRLLIGN